MLAASFAGCMHGDSGNAARNGVEQHVETQMDENEGCPDGECPDNGDKCPDGKCPVRPVQPRGRHGRVKPLPCPHN